MYFVTKTYRDLPAAHRQPNHNGHCRLIHGHNWRFDISFVCETLDNNGFVLDVGKLSPLKEKLVDCFDHTLLLNEDDPESARIERFMEPLLARIIIVPNCGMEGLAKYVLGMTEEILESNFESDIKHRGLSVVQVTCWEDSKNRATYNVKEFQK